MKLHDFILSQQSDDVQKLRDLGRSMLQPSSLRVSEAEKKPQVVKSKADSQVEDASGMTAAIAELTADHKVVRNKIKNYD